MEIRVGGMATFGLLVVLSTQVAVTQIELQSLERLIFVSFFAIDILQR